VRVRHLPRVLALAVLAALAALAACAVHAIHSFIPSMPFPSSSLSMPFPGVVRIHFG
jgi:hypothetical protein